MLIAAIVVNYSFPAPSAKLKRCQLREFPIALREWISVAEHNIGENSMAVLQVDDYLMRTYTNKKGETVGLYIGYFKTQQEGKQIHSPRQCLLGSGWNIVKNEEYLLTLKDHNPSKVPINLLLMGKEEQRQLYLWWYQGRGRIYANEYLNKLYLIWDSIVKHRKDGALVRVNTAVADNLDQALEIQINFINLLVPLLTQYIPD